jgi:hypothetical protein
MYELPVPPSSTQVKPSGAGPEYQRQVRPSGAGFEYPQSPYSKPLTKRPTEPELKYPPVYGRGRQLEQARYIKTALQEIGIISYNWLWKGQMPDRLPANPSYLQALGAQLGVSNFNYQDLWSAGYTFDPTTGYWVRGRHGGGGWGGGGGGGRKKTIPKKYSSTGREVGGGYDSQGALVSWRLGA